MKFKWLFLALLFNIGVGGNIFAQSPSNTYNWDLVFSGSVTLPPNQVNFVPMTGNLTVVIHNNGTNTFVPQALNFDEGSFSGSNTLGLFDLEEYNLSGTSVAPSSSATVTITPVLALRATGTGVLTVKPSVHALTIEGCDDVVYVSFNASGGWTVTGTGGMSVSNATWTPSGPTVHIYRNGPGAGGREGVTEVSTGALDWHVDIGSAGQEGGAMSLELHSDVLDEDTAKSSRFEYMGMASGPVEVINAGQGRRQFVSPSGLANLQDIKDGSNNYLHTELTLYHQAGTKAGSYYPGVGSPYKTITFTYEYDSGDHVDSLTLVETEGGDPEETVYEYDRDTSEWALVTDGGQKKEKFTEIVTSGTRTVTRQVLSGSNVLLSKIQETYTPYAWGDELTRQVNDPDGLALTMTWSYGTTVGANDYRRLIKTKDHRGHWRKFQYDNEGRVTKTITQFLNAPDTATESQSRVLTTIYDGENRTDVETLLGKEIGRTYTLWSGSAQNVKRVEQCVTAGAAPGASDSLVTTTTYLPSGEVIVRPDATVEKITRETLSGGGLRTTTEIGQSGTTGAVVAGRKQVVERDSRGNVMSDTTRDIATDLVIAQSTVVDTDEFGRAIEISYLDGTTEEFEYSCCGLAFKTDRTGLVTSYEHDAFGNIAEETTAGVTTKREYDALGRLIRVYRIGSDSSSIFQAGVNFNLAGQQIARLSASGTTLVSTTYDGTGIETQSETRPGGGTSIQKTFPDGKLKEIGGTMEFPRIYEYGFDSTNGRFVKEILVGDGGTTTEWIKTFYDLMGRPWKKQYPDSATETSYWNNLGQLIRSVDPDGITQLYRYNSFGEREDTAIDVNGNNQIDYSGNDRISRTRFMYLTSGGKTVMRQTQSAWKESGEIQLSEADSSLTSVESWQRSFGVEIHAETVFSGSGSFTVSEHSNTGRVVTKTYVAGRLISMITTTSSGENVGGQLFTYDAHGRIASEAKDGLAPSNYTYFDTNLVHMVTQDGNSVEFEYDAQGNRTNIIRTGGVKTQLEYYPTGHLKKIFGALVYPVDYTYDLQGRMKTLTAYGSAGTAVTTWNYHPQRGWLDNKRYANNKGPDYTYTAGGRLKTRKWARSAATGGRLTTTYHYTAAGDVDSFIYSDGSLGFDCVYDRLGRIDAVTQGSTIYDYSWADDGQLTGDTLISGTLTGIETSFGYDTQRRLETITIGSGTNAVVQSYNYDSASRLSTVGQGDFLASYVYVDGASRIDRIEFRHSGSLKAQTERGYDSRGRFESVLTKRIADNSVISSFVYSTNDLNQRSQVALLDGTQWDYGYDGLGQVISANRSWGGITPVLGQQFSYDFDSIGNRIDTITNGRSAGYDVNILNQYTKRQVPPAIDIVGSATSSAIVTVNGGTASRSGNYFYEELTVDNSDGPKYLEVTVNAIMTATGTSGALLQANKTGDLFVPQSPEMYSYDDDGNLTSDGRFEYSWNAENRLVGIRSLLNQSEDARRKVKVSYDPWGRMVEIVKFRWSKILGDFSENESLKIGWFMTNPVVEVRNSGEINTHLWGLDVSNSFFDAGGAGGLLSTMGSGSSWFYGHDGVANVVMAADIELISSITQIEYDPFGSIVRGGDELKSSLGFRFSDKYFDDDTGLSFFQERWYNSSTGRWLSRDPIGERSGDGLYGFIGNSPVNHVDVLGREKAPDGIPIFHDSDGRWRNNLGRFIEDPGISKYPLFVKVPIGNINGLRSLPTQGGGATSAAADLASGAADLLTEYATNDFAAKARAQCQEKMPRRDITFRMGNDCYCCVVDLLGLPADGGVSKRTVWFEGHGNLVNKTCDQVQEEREGAPSLRPTLDRNDWDPIGDLFRSIFRPQGTTLRPDPTIRETRYYNW